MRTELKLKLRKSQNGICYVNYVGDLFLLSLTNSIFHKNIKFICKNGAQ